MNNSGTVMNAALQETKLEIGPGKQPNPPMPRPYFIESSFFSGAEQLRDQFETQISQSVEMNDGLTPLLYGYNRNVYRFLTSTAERIFSRELLEELMTALRNWAVRQTGASRISTPQLRVYINGCWRDLLRDNIDAQWHWMLSLGRPANRKIGRLKVLTETISSTPGDDSLSLERVLDMQLRFNSLLVHPAANAYSIEVIKGSMDPLEGAVFLDGYMW
jgi:hypothetical protein